MVGLFFYDNVFKELLYIVDSLDNIEVDKVYLVLWI